MKAIPTTYKGTAFRSRLEANFASHFDALEIGWEYEPEAFELEGGKNYLPDFYLPEIRAWVEVKGRHMERVDKFELFAKELWSGFNESCGDLESIPSDPLSPLCIIATVEGNNATRFVACREPGSNYSIFLSRCLTCWENTFSTPGFTECRRCGVLQAWGDDWSSGLISLSSSFGTYSKLTIAPVDQWMPR